MIGSFFFFFFLFNQHNSKTERDKAMKFCRNVHIDNHMGNGNCPRQFIIMGILHVSV